MLTHASCCGPFAHTFCRCLPCLPHNQHAWLCVGPLGRSPAHCIEYAKIILWPKERPDDTFDAGGVLLALRQRFAVPPLLCLAVLPTAPLMPLLPPPQQLPAHCLADGMHTAFLPLPRYLCECCTSPCKPKLHVSPMQTARST